MHLCSELVWFTMCCLVNSYSTRNVVRDNYMTLAAHFTADQLHKALRSHANELLGVPVMQAIIDGLTFKEGELNASLLHDVSERLDGALSKYVALLNKTRAYVSATHRRQAANFRVYRSLVECSRISPALLSYEEQFGTRVNLSSACSVADRHSVNVLYYPDKDLINVVQSNARDSGVRWQYVIGVHGTHLEYPSHMFPVNRRRHWAPFIASALPYPKRVLLLLDIGTVQNEAQLLSLKNVAKILLDAASPGDKYMVMLATGSYVTRACVQNTFVDSSPNEMAALVAFIDGLQLTDGSGYSHTRAIHTAFELFAEEEGLSRNEVKHHNVLHYVSRGVMSELSEAASVLNAVAQLVIRTNVRVKLNTLALVNGEKAPMLWSRDFLKSIAEQNLAKYRQSLDDKTKLALDAMHSTPPRGMMVVVNESEYSVLSLSRVTALLRDELRTDTVEQQHPVFWSHPFTEYQSTLLSISMPVYKDAHLMSVVGMDVNMEVIADVVKYTDLVVMAPLKTCLRVMVCDCQGRVLVDSKVRNSHPWPLHMADLEAWSWADRWLTEPFASTQLLEGSFDVQRTTTNATFTVKYTWKRLRSAPLVVVFALRSSMDMKVALLEKNTRQQYALDNLAYHRLDIQRDAYVPYCMHLGSLSSMKLGGVYLSPTCFTASSIQRPPSAQWIANYWVYLGDPFGLIRNTGIRTGVREHVGALSGIVAYWRDGVSTSWNEYVVRRYVATWRGVMITYPATVVRDNYEPDVHPWFTRAVKFPGRIVLTGPMLDDQVGQIVTISTAIFEGQADSTHDANEDQVFAVIAMDVTVGLLTTVLRGALPVCKESRRCVLFDDLGYVLSRGSEAATPPARTAPRSSSAADAVERFHLSHVEPQLATHLIMNRHLVAKQQCAQWASRTQERLFQFNVTYSDAFTVWCDESTQSSSTHKARSLRAEVIPVPHSNVFLALVNDSCSPLHPIQAFCPCSVSDRRCLLCSRFDDTECECPCQCAIPMHSQCTSLYLNASAMSTTVPTEQLQSRAPMEQCWDSVRLTPFVARLSHKTALPQCVHIRCEDKPSMETCVGVIGCEWCSIDSDGTTALRHAFCARIARCYAGVKDRPITSLLDTSSQLSSQWSMATPVGPVAAGIMSVFLIMVIAVYCYRSQVNRLVETRSLTDSFGAPLCARSQDDDDFQFDHDGSASSDEKRVRLIQLASFERTCNPPATVRAQYRLSPRTESSDHGYSTMTDRMAGDDSECAASSVNVSRQSGRTELTTIYANEDCCSSMVTTEADVHHVPVGVLLAS